MQGMTSADDRVARAEAKVKALSMDVVVNGCALPIFIASQPIEGAHSRNVVLPPPRSSAFSLRITNLLSRRLCFRLQVRNILANARYVVEVCERGRGSLELFMWLTPVFNSSMSLSSVVSLSPFDRLSDNYL
jgi:hypothetical protein